MQNPTRGRVYRRCACRDGAGDQLGPRCPKLGNRSHGRWSYAVDLAPVDGNRKTRRRGGFATKQEARAALAKILEFEHTGLVIDDRQAVTDYLTEWMRTKALTLKPTTIANYQRYLTQDLLPSLGHLRLETLNHRHVMLFVHDQLNAGRGLTTIRRCVATLSSALHDAVRQRRLPHNAARYATVPRPPKYERTCWTPAQAARFLRHCADHDDPLTDLFEVIIGTGMRRGEALALHWADIHLNERLLYVRYTLSNINTTPVFTTPKTPQQPSLDQPVRPGHRRPAPSSSTPARTRPGIHSQGRTTTATRVRSTTLPRPQRTSRATEDSSARPATLRRDHHAQLAGSTGDGIQNTAPLHGIDDHRDLRAPAQTSRQRRSQNHRSRPRKLRPQSDHKRLKTNQVVCYLQQTTWSRPSG